MLTRSTFESMSVLAMKAINEFKYFSGEELLKMAFPMSKKEVRKLFPETKIKSADSFDFWVGGDRFSKTEFKPVTRIICYKINGSKHKCDARCRTAKGGNCECSCGGNNHGIDG